MNRISPRALFSPGFSRFHAHSSQQGGKARLIAEAELIAQLCKDNPHLSVYSHRNIMTAYSIPTYHFNCYGFLADILLRTNLEAYHEIYRWAIDQHEKSVLPKSSDARVCPYHYVAFFKEIQTRPSIHWRAVTSISDVARGDILAYTPEDYIPREESLFTEKSTGTHVMVIQNVYGRARNHINLSIIDSTKRPHSTSGDSRSEGGIGTAKAIIHFRDRFKGIQWDPEKGIRPRNIQIGRIVSS